MNNLVIRKYDDIDFREVISLLKSQFNISDSIFETIFGNTFALNTNTNIAV